MLFFLHLNARDKLRCQYKDTISKYKELTISVFDYIVYLLCMSQKMVHIFTFFHPVKFLSSSYGSLLSLFYNAATTSFLLMIYAFLLAKIY